MAHFGLPELLVASLAALAAAIPIATFVFSILTYRKVTQLEARFAPSSPPSGSTR